MRKIFLALLGFLFVFTIFSKAYAEKAEVEFVDAQGNKIGKATLSQEEQGVRLSIDVSDLKPGSHGIHIHSVGKCEPPDFKSAGSHFNPSSKKHGLKSKEGPHVGDLPNLIVAEDGKSKTEWILQNASLTEGPDSLLKPEGTAIVIHESADDEQTDPAGNSGARVACGVIAKV